MHDLFRQAFEKTASTAYSRYVAKKVFKSTPKKLTKPMSDAFGKAKEKALKNAPPKDTRMPKWREPATKKNVNKVQKKDVLALSPSKLKDPNSYSSGWNEPSESSRAVARNLHKSVKDTKGYKDYASYRGKMWAMKRKMGKEQPLTAKDKIDVRKINFPVKKPAYRK